MSNNIKYVFWDSDNTLVKTAEMHWRKHVEILKSHGIALTKEYRTDIYTNNGQQNWQWITEKLGLKSSMDDYLSQIDSWFFDHMDKLEVRSGVLELIEIFAQANIKQAVVSNGRKRSVMAALNTKDIAPKMEFILCKEDYEGRKPDAAPYLTALAKMNDLTGGDVQPSQCLVIEDDPKGVAVPKYIFDVVTHCLSAL